MEGVHNMNKTPNIIWGRTPLTDKTIRLLKMKGIEEVFVRDPNQSEKVKEENAVVYLSPEGVVSLFKYAPEVVHHIFVCIPPGSTRKK